MKPPRPPKVNHEVAWWAALSAFFGSLLTVGAIDWLKPDSAVRFASSLFIAVITGGAVYAKQRLDEARRKSKEDAADG
jgi:hypothetical protein